MAQKSRSYVFTFNNWTDEVYNDMIDDFDKYARYYVIGKEVGDSGTPHLQGHVEFKNARSYKAINKKFPGIHTDIRKGTPKQASDYCKKEGDYVEFGELPCQGSRTDLDIVREDVKNGVPMREISQKVGYQGIRMAEKMYSYCEMKRNWKTHVTWLYGPTGSGKSKLAAELLPNAWWNMASMKWFEGYDAHEDVVFDDFRKEQCSFSYLLRLLDRYELRIEFKGGSRQFLAKRIVITTTKSPQDTFRDPTLGLLEHGETDGTEEDIQQLMRRIEVVRYVGYSSTSGTEVGGNTNPNFLLEDP